METLYLIYIKIPEIEYNRRMKFLVSNGDTYRLKLKTKIMKGLYAWTFDEEKVEEFLKQRTTSIYKIKKKEVESADSIRNFLLDNSELKLVYKDFDDLVNPVVITKNERNQVEDNFAENIYDHIINYCKFNYDYIIFNEKIMRALDILGYTYLYDRYATTDNSREEELSYNESFDLTNLGGSISKSIEFRSELSVFKYLFRFAIYGA